MKLGLLGKNISYSFSKEYFEKKFKELNLESHCYQIFDFDNLDEIKKLLSQDINGFNVTIPYKEKIIPFLDELSPEAQNIGAVNTVKIYNGKSKGYNTDYVGFKNSLIPIIGNRKNALILGSGGASKAISKALEEMNIKYSILSRKDNSYQMLTKKIIEKNLLIINTTPIGTFPNVNQIPDFPVEFITKNHLLYDLIYNPKITKLMHLAQKKGASIKNGLEMLHLQADAAWKIWNSNF